ncbi:MAG: glycosyltransferase family 4 protein, partial [Planctomycetes bacterium]|nr:glycosyltransferase family 4 protein [Planctomycetota bacterium]
MKHYEIAILLGYPEISGGTNVILEHALGLTRLGHSVSIVTEQPFDPQRLSWKPAAQELPLLCHADCRERMFDVSVATWWRSVFDLPHVPAHRYTYFCQSIESRFFSEQEPDMKALVDFTYRQPLPVVTEASWIAQYLREYYGRETALVRNGIDKSIFRPDGERLAPRPRAGLRGLVEGPLGVSFKRVEFTIRLCQQAGIEDIWLLTSTDCSSYPGVSRVLSRVPMQEVGAVYRSCDVLVKLSTVEGMFGPPLEMMHCGGTAITSDVTGHEEYMRHGQNGIVIRRGEEAEVIDYLRALHRDRAFLNLLKDGARTTAAEWPDWSHATREMEQFVCELCQREPTHKSVQHDMLTQLRAALRLAGPLREAVAPDHSGRELLGMAWAKLRAKVARKLGPRPTAANGAP